jgi:hypothetical protein
VSRDETWSLQDASWEVGISLAAEILESDKPCARAGFTRVPNERLSLAGVKGQVFVDGANFSRADTAHLFLKINPRGVSRDETWSLQDASREVGISLAAEILEAIS